MQIGRRPLDVKNDQIVPIISAQPILSKKRCFFAVPNGTKYSAEEIETLMDYVS